MFKKLWERFIGCITTSYDIELNFEITRLFIGIALGFILTTAILITYVK